MDRSYSETNEEKDFTDGTIKRRISSILKAPRTPLQTLGSGNELIQNCNVEKRQRNSRRVSFADTIRVFPPDPQIIVESKQAETAGEPRVQDFFQKNEDPEVVSCEITGMSTLLHAPIQTCLQPTECWDAESCQAWNKMDRTVIFSDENEMDMTSGHTMLITHDIRISEEINNTRKINFEPYSADLKSGNETSQMNECHLFSSPEKMKQTSLSQQRLNTENTPKINFSDFMNSLKSTVHSLPAGVLERKVGYSYFHEEDCNTTTASEVVYNIQNHVTSKLSNKSTVTLPSKQVAYEQENTGMVITNMENVLPPGTSSLNIADSQESSRRDWSASNNMDSNGLKTSRNPFGVQEDQRVCANEVTMNHIESIADKKHTEIKEDAPFDHYYKTSIMPRPVDSVTSMPVFHADKTTAFCDFSADMELTGNCTGLACEENFKGIGNPFALDFGKQGNNVSRLMEKTIFQEEHMDITNNQIPSHSYLHSALNERPGPLQEVTYNTMGLPNSRILDIPQTSCLPETNYCPLGPVTKSFGSQAVSPFLSSSNDIIQQAHTIVGENKMEKKSGLSNRVSLISDDKTATFHFSENMDITKPITYLENSLNAHRFLAMPQQGIENDRKNVIGLNSNNTVQFSLNEDNEIDITRSHTVPVKCYMQPCQRTHQACSIQSATESVYMCNDYMDETRAITGVIDQFIETPTEKRSNESRRRTLTGPLKDRTIALNDENEMEITQSHTVALKHDDVAKSVDVPVSSALFSKKTSMLTVGEDMKITKPVEYVTEKSLQNERKKEVTTSASEKTRPALTEHNGMRLTKRLTMAVEETPQLFSLMLAEKRNMSIHSGDISQSTHFVPANKTILFMHNNDMEITKPMTSTSLKDTRVNDLEVEKEETIKMILQGRTKEETDAYLPDNCEMEITRNHTVQINHDILHQVKETPQGLTSASVGKTNIFTHLSDAKTQSKTFVPADKTFTCNNDLEITMPVSDASFTALSLKGKEIRKTTLLGLDKYDTIVFSQHDAEMENTKCHTVRVTHDILSQCARSPQVSFHQDNMNTTGSHTVTKEMVADDPQVNKKHSITLDNKTDLPCKATLQAEPSFPVSTNATYNGNLEESEKKEMPDKNIKQNMNKVLSHTYGEEIQDIDVTENQVVSIYGSNNDVPDATKEILNPFTKSNEKAVVSDGNNMEITQNYRTGIEFMHMNDNNECHTNSEAKLSSRFPPLVNDYKSKLEIAKTEKNPKLTTKLDSSLSVKEDPKKDLDTAASTEWTEGASLKVPLHTESYNITKLPLGIFPPKLPSKRKSTVSNTECATAGLEKRKQAQDSEVSPLIKRLSDKLAQNPNLSCYINEELLPAYEEEIDSNEALSCDMPEKLYDVQKDVGTTGNEGGLTETNKRQRALNQENEELQKEKKFKRDEGWNDSTDFKQPLCSTAIAYIQGATQEDKNVPELIAVNLEKTQGSNCSSLDSGKTDTDFSSFQRNSEMETPLLVDSICEQNLQEKLQEGTITVREFFTLLEVHVLIQKPRQSVLPPKYEVNTTPNLEDEIINQYVYHPKLLSYNEDCQALCKTIDELKVNANDQDKLLVNVHKSLWEVMRTCSDEELKGFGAELNKMKSCFTKKSKVLAHKGKAKLYSKLVQNAELQWEKLQSRLAKIDELLQEMDSCINALETEAAALKEAELDVNDVSEYESKVRDTERELEDLRIQEEALQRDQSNLRNKKQHHVSEISHLQEYVKNCQDITEKYNFSEWVMKEWNDHQAVFTFLYDSIELLVELECPVDGAGYNNKIVSVNFESLLDDDRALPSSKLVHRLIFQFINSQSSRLEKCSTVHHLSQILHDVSVVASRCQLLGEEIEFLDRWGGKFYLLKTEVNDTKVKFLFSSSVACSSFEVEFSLSANYPVSPVAFIIQKCTGNLSQGDISMILSNVPVGTNYLRRIVKEISHNLLQCSPSTIQKQQRVAVR